MSLDKMTMSVPLLLLLLFAWSGHQVQAADYVAEIYFVVDAQVVKNYQELGYDKPTAISTIKGDVDFIVNEANNYYKDMAKKGLNIEIRMKKLDILVEDDEQIFDDCKLIRGNEIQGDMAMEVFKEWLQANNIYTQHGYDIAMIWTGYDMTSGFRQNGPVGYARIASVCSPDLALGIVEFDGTQLTAATTAHEIAHNLGSDHDGVGKCVSDNGYIMTPFVSPHAEHRWEFSNCTVTSIIKNIDRLNKEGMNCMTKANTTTPDPGFRMSSQLGRDILDPRKVCPRFTRFNESYFCATSDIYNLRVVKGDPVCRSLYCSTTSAAGSCTASIPTEGMVCDDGKRCSQGKCVAAPLDLPTPKNIVKDCIYGDSKIDYYFGPALTCDQYLKDNGLGACYEDRVQTDCCQTCPARKLKTKGCEFGDRLTSCTIDHCSSFYEDCCLTCRNWKGKRSSKSLSTVERLFNRILKGGTIRTRRPDLAKKVMKIITL